MIITTTLRRCILQSVLGKSLPIAFALDGCPIYGLTEPDGTAAYVNNQKDPQPSARTLRPSGTPLNGATLLGFTNSATDQFSLRYRLTGNTTDFFGTTR